MVNQKIPGIAALDKALGHKTKIIPTNATVRGDLAARRKIEDPVGCGDVKAAPKAQTRKIVARGLSDTSQTKELPNLIHCVSQSLGSEASEFRITRVNANKCADNVSLDNSIRNLRA